MGNRYRAVWVYPLYGGWVVVLATEDALGRVQRRWRTRRWFAGPVPDVWAYAERLADRHGVPQEMILQFPAAP